MSAMDNSTIAAISTPAGSGGIGIIKISGPKAIDIALTAFKPKSWRKNSGNADKKPENARFLKSHRLYYGHIVDTKTDRILDEVLFVIMRAPYSYTTEDVVEVQAHAGILVLKSILTTLINNGAQLAEPGEFTRRAFLNGRIDLTQAEAVIDVINAKSDSAIDMAMAQISGALKQTIESLRSELIDILSFIDASIDFQDDIDDTTVTAGLVKRIEENIIFQIKSLIRHYENENFLREGLKVVIVGGPNVGKSSLMNRLINRERSIVTDIPGTTRDFIEDSFITKGVPIIVTDTAGMHDDPDPVERIGIDKAWEYISTADIILFTVDAGKSVNSTEMTLFKKFCDKKTITVINKTDIPKENICFKLPTEWGEVQHLEISALYNRGIDDLKDLIAKTAFESVSDMGQKIIPNLRQKNALKKALASLTAAVEGLRQTSLFELVSIDLKSALASLSEIVGDTVNPDILATIFNRFCIGK